jgi:hypothetical protein
MRNIYVKNGPVSCYKDGGTEEYKGWDGKHYFVDYRIGSVTKGHVFDRYPDDKKAIMLDAKLVQCSVPPDDMEEAPRGFVSAPTIEQLQLTKDEIAKLKQLLLWLEASKLDRTIWNAKK